MIRKEIAIEKTKPKKYKYTRLEIPKVVLNCQIKAVVCSILVALT
jgi:hypothetical protein